MSVKNTTSPVVNLLSEQTCNFSNLEPSGPGAEERCSACSSPVVNLLSAQICNFSNLAPSAPGAEERCSVWSTELAPRDPAFDLSLRKNTLLKHLYNAIKQSSFNQAASIAFLLWEEGGLTNAEAACFALFLDDQSLAKHIKDHSMANEEVINLIQSYIETDAIETDALDLLINPQKQLHDMLLFCRRKVGHLYSIWMQKLTTSQIESIITISIREPSQHEFTKDLMAQALGFNNSQSLSLNDKQTVQEICSLAIKQKSPIAEMIIRFLPQFQDSFQHYLNVSTLYLNTPFSRFLTHTKQVFSTSQSLLSCLPSRFSHVAYFMTINPDTGIPLFQKTLNSLRVNTMLDLYLFASISGAKRYIEEMEASFDPRLIKHAKMYTQIKKYAHIRKLDISLCLDEQTYPGLGITPITGPRLLNSTLHLLRNKIWQCSQMQPETKLGVVQQISRAAKSLCNNKTTYPDLAQAITNNQLVLLNTGWSRHCTYIVFYKNRVVKCNRGSRCEGKPGLHIYTRTSPVSPSFLQRLHLRSSPPKYFNSEIDAELGLSKHEYIHLEPQTTGNCAWASATAAVYASLELLLREIPSSQTASCHEITHNLYQEWLKSLEKQTTLNTDGFEIIAHSAERVLVVENTAEKILKKAS